MEQNNNLLNFNFTKKERGVYVKNVLNYILNSGFLPSHRINQGCKIKFKKINNANIIVSSNIENNTITLSSEFFTKKENFAKEFFALCHEIRQMAQYSGKFNDKHPVDKISPIFTGTEDINQMITLEKCGIADKPVNDMPESKKELYNQVKKDVECYLAGKYFISPRQKACRVFAKKVMAKLVQDNLNMNINEQEKELLQALQTFVSHQKLEELKQEEFVENYIKTVEISIIQTMQVAQKRIGSWLQDLNYDNEKVEKFTQDFGYNPIKATGQSLAIAYNDKLANDLFKQCLFLENNKKQNINQAIDLIKYTDFYPSKANVQLLNEQSREFNNTCENEKEKIHPKKILKAFYNIESHSSIMESIATDTASF